MPRIVKRKVDLKVGRIAQRVKPEKRVPKGNIQRKNGVEVKHSTSRSAWKAFEREVARDFGTERQPGSGGIVTLNTRSDTQHANLFIEAKYRDRHAVWALYQDTNEKAIVEGKLPVVVLKQKGESGYLLVIDPKHLNQIAKDYVRGKK